MIIFIPIPGGFCCFSTSKCCNAERLGTRTRAHTRTQGSGLLSFFHRIQATEGSSRFSLRSRGGQCQVFPGRQARRRERRVGRRGSGGAVGRGWSGAGGGMLAAGAPSAGNSAAQVKRSRGGRGSGSTNGRAVCKYSGPGEPMRAAAALRRGTGWLRGEAGSEGGTAPAIHAPVPYTRVRRRRPGPVQPLGARRGRAGAVTSGKRPGPPKLFAQKLPALTQRRGEPRTAPRNQRRASAPPRSARCPPRAALGETRPAGRCGDETRPLPTGTSSPAAVPLCRAGAALLGHGGGGAAGIRAQWDACGWERGAQPVAVPLRCHRDGLIWHRSPAPASPSSHPAAALHGSEVRTRKDRAR